MARVFLSSSSRYFISGSAVLTATPLTMACWANFDNVTGSEVLMSIGTNGGTARWMMFGDGAAINFSDAIVVTAINSGGTGSPCGSTATYSAGSWVHACGVYSSDTNRAAFLNGSNKGTVSSSITVSGIDRTLLGARISGGAVGAYLNGKMAEAAIWNVALGDDEVATLAAGFCPLLVRPQSLVAYWPLHARATNEEDWSGGFTMTNTNSVAAGAHPNRIIYPSRPRIIIPAAAAGGTTVAHYAGGGFGSGQAAAGFYIGAD